MSGGSHDAGTHGYGTAEQRVYRGHYRRFVSKERIKITNHPSTATDRAEKVKSERTDTLAPEVRFEVPLTELTIFAKPI